MLSALNYTNEHWAYKKRFRAFLDREVVPNIETWNAQHLIPRDLWLKLGSEGFLCPWVAPKYGGQGKDFLYSVIMIETLAEINYLALFSYLHSDVVVPYIDSFGSEEIKQRYLPGCVSGDIITAVGMTEPDAGSDLAALGTTAVEAGREVVINGSKTFISNGVNCDLVVLAAKDPQASSPHKAISLYLVEARTAGFDKGTPFVKMGLHSQDTTDHFFNNCRIPRGNRLGEKGTGFAMLMQKLQQERLVCAIEAMAMGKFALDWTMGHLKQTGSAGNGLAGSQPVQFALAEMATKVSLGKTYLDRLIADHMAGKNVTIETSMAKYWVTEQAKLICERCIDFIGETGDLDSCPVVRTYNDVRVMSIYAGTNEVMKTIIAKALLR